MFTFVKLCILYDWQTDHPQKCAHGIDSHHSSFTIEHSFVVAIVWWAKCLDVLWHKKKSWCWPPGFIDHFTRTEIALMRFKDFMNDPFDPVSHENERSVYEIGVEIERDTSFLADRNTPSEQESCAHTKRAILSVNIKRANTLQLLRHACQPKLCAKISIAIV